MTTLNTDLTATPEDAEFAPRFESRRRTTAVEGCVNFPVEKTNTGEGGMFVKLWVIDPREYGESYGVCCGTLTHELKLEVLMGSDKRKRPQATWLDRVDELTPEEMMAAYKQEDAANQEFEEFFYPIEKDDGDRLSTGLLTSVLMGSTGWSGEFICTYENLTPQGKALYDAVQTLYPEADLYLMTFLDT